MELTLNERSLLHDILFAVENTIDENRDTNINYENFILELSDKEVKLFRNLIKKI